MRYRHPTGVHFEVPAGWRAHETPLGVQLVPPDVTAGPHGPTEMYAVTGQPAPGIAAAGDPRVIAYLDQATATLVPFLRRAAAPEAIGSGVRLRYAGTNPMTAIACDALSLVTLMNGYAIGVFGVGERSRFGARAALLEEVFRSLAWGEGERDPQLAGVWHYWSWRGGKVSAETRRQAQLLPDGRVFLTSTTETVGDLEGRDGTGHRTWTAGWVGQGGGALEGRWTAARGQLFIQWNDGTTLSGQYQISGYPGNRRLVVQAPGGERQEWSEQPIQV